MVVLSRKSSDNDSRSGNSLGAKISKYTKPVATSTTANGVISKRVNGSNPFSRATPSTRRLVEVPIKVQIPPNIETYESGISNLEEEVPSSLATCITIGIIITTTGVLFMNAEANTTRQASNPIVNPGCFFPPLRIINVTEDNAPVRTNAPDRMNIAKIVHGAGFEKTCRASSNGRIPNTRRTEAPPRAVTSTGRYCFTKSTNMPITTHPTTRGDP